MKGIKIKMLLAVCMLLIIVCVGFGISSYVIASNVLTDNVNLMLPQLAQQGANVVEKELDDQFSSLEVLAANDIIGDPNITLVQKQILMQKEFKRSDDIDVNLADTDGICITADGKRISIKDRAYFQKALSGGKAVSDPVENRNIPGTVIVNYAVPVKWEGKIVGVLFKVTDAAKLSAITNKITLGSTGKAYMINKQTTAIAHYNYDFVLKMDNTLDNVSEDSSLQSIASLQKEMTKGKVGYGLYSYIGKVRYVGFAPVKGTEWFLGVIVPQDDILSGLNVIRNSAIVIAVILLLISSVAGYILLGFITRPIIAISEQLKIFSGGDFSKELPESYIKMKDEIGILAKAASTMSENLRGFISQVANSVEQVAASSEELTASAEQQALASNDVAAAITGVAIGTEKQTSALVETSMVIEQISAGIQEASASSVEVAEHAVQTSLLAKDGQKAVAMAVNQMDKIENMTKNVKLAIDQLAVGSNEIGEITDAISGIAAQTNLLALNAAIEAARAGEQGKGFAVVADEVRKLAEQASEAAKQITSLIHDNQNNIDHAVVAMEANVEDVKTGLDVVKTTGDTFMEIASSINQVVSQIREVSTTFEQIAHGSQKMVTSIKLIENISNENTNQSQTVSAATEEQAASAEQIASSSQNLAKMAQDLQAAVGKFCI